MFFPYKDDNPRILVPYVTYSILAVNVLVFIYQTFLMSQISQQAFTLRFGLIPAYFWSGDNLAVLEYNRKILEQLYPPSTWSSLLHIQLLPGVLTLFTSPFIHAGWMHIIGNMLFLYVFADNVEGALGHVRFVLFYFLTALAAGFLHLVVVPGSMLPVVGASGAVSGVLGGYLVRYPRARIHVLVFIVIFITTIRLPAMVVLGFWFLIQAVSGLVSLQAQLVGGVAWFEHIGGFVAGFSYMVISSWGSKFRFRRNEYY